MPKLDHHLLSKHTRRSILLLFTLTLLLQEKQQFVLCESQVPYVRVKDKPDFADETLIINENTLFLANLKPPKNCPNASLWFSNNAEFNLTTSIPALLEDQRNATFDNINSESAYIFLPGGHSFKDTRYFGLRSTNPPYNMCLRLKLPDISNEQFENKNNHDKTEDGELIVRLPKCCELNKRYVMDKDGSASCKNQVDSIPFNFSLLNHNETHIDNEPLNQSLYKIEPYFHYPCKSQKYIDEPTNFYVLRNGSLYVKNDKKLTSLDDFCVERIEDEKSLPDEYYVFHCYEDKTHLSTASKNFFRFSLIISLILLLLLIVCYVGIPDLREPISWNTAGYATCLFISVLILLYSTFAPSDNKNTARIYHCILLTSLYYFSAMNCELYFGVKFHAEKHPYSNKKRIKFYVVISVVLFVICCIAHFAGHSLVKLPVYVIYNDMAVPEVSDGVIVTYVLHFLMLLFNAFLLGFTYWKIDSANSNTNPNKRFWAVLKRKYTTISRANTILFLLIFIYLISEFITYFYEVDNKFLIFYTFHALHGTMFVLIYMWRKEILASIKKFYYNRKCNDESSPNANGTFAEQPLTLNEEMTDVPLTEIKTNQTN